MEISDTVTSTPFEFYLFITLLYVFSISLQKLITLFSSTYISVVIDCIFSNKVKGDSALIYNINAQKTLIDKYHYEIKNRNKNT
jgi:hypothetical protein